MSAAPYELPDGWAWATLGSVARLNMGQSPRGVFTNDLGEGVPLVGGASDLENGRPKPGRYTTRPTKLCRAGDIIICVRATIGKIAKADAEYCLGRGVAALEPSHISGDFLQRYLSASVEELRELGTGTTFEQISKDDLERFPVPFPPLSEQRRIVAKIEALFEQSRTAREALDRIPPLLKKFRQSVLAAAFRGDLTRDWRDQHPDVEPAPVLLERIRAERRRKWEEDLRAKGKDPRKAKYQAPRPVDISGQPELPEGWAWVPFGTLISFVTSGSRAWAKYYSEGGPIFLRVGNLDHDSISLDLTQIARVKPPDGAEGTRTRVEPGDILISITADVGMVGVAPEDIGDAYINQHVALARPLSGPSVPYLAYYLAAEGGGQKQFREMQYGMTKTGLSLANVQDVRIPFAPLSEQHCIVAEIEEMFSRTKAVETVLHAARRRANKLEQSILARAFRGELVPQHPTDEPASVLLDRIRAEGTERSPSKQPLTIVRRPTGYRQPKRRATP